MHAAVADSLRSGPSDFAALARYAKGVIGGWSSTERLERGGRGFDMRQGDEENRLYG
jgi:hypothetical protein